MNPRRGLGLLVGFVVGGAIVFPMHKVSAQSKIVPDDTLRTPQKDESSVVISNFRGFPVELITGGAKRNNNLFHSFLQFNISEGRGAYFVAPSTDIQNILARVTGGSSSQIQGQLGTFQLVGNNLVPSQANLFLINPNGIIFGPNASLSIGGSFVGTTANAIEFGNQGSFSASVRNMPSSLLTVNPSAFLFNQIASQPLNSIENRGLLSVPAGQSLLLVGGNVSPSTNSTGGILLGGGTLYAPGGRVELGGVTEAARVGLDNNLSLRFPDSVARADVTLTDSSKIDVTAGGDGNIAVNARNINVLAGSILLAGIGQGLGSVNSQAGDIDLKATGAIALDDSSFIANVVQTEAMGQGGNVNIKADSLSATNGSQLAASTNGLGNAGSVAIDAQNFIFFDGVGRTGFSSGAFSTVASGGIGNAGNINVTTGSLYVTRGGGLNATAFRQGNAGSVTLSARDVIFFDGVGTNGNPSGVLSTVQPGVVGNGGDIDITTKSLFLANGAEINAATAGQGNAGNITVRASNAIFLDGVGSNGVSSGSGIFSTVNPGASGNGGDIRVSAKSLSLTNGAVLAAVMGGQGQGGNINITTDSLSVMSGAQVNASTLGQGNAGSIVIEASNSIFLSGVGSDGSSSGIFSFVGDRAVGKAGDINITTGALSLIDGSELNSSTYGQGNAGKVKIIARDAIFNGVGSNGNPSGVISQVNPKAMGNGGDINIKVGSLSITNGAEVNAATEGQGDAASVTIQASNAVLVDGGSKNKLSSGVFSTVDPGAVGKGGDINITTGLLSLANGGLLSASSGGGGKAGNIQVTAHSIYLDSQGGIESITLSGSGGNITLRSQDMLLLRHNSLISTSAGITQAGGDGGNITINAPLIVAVPKEDSDIRANAFTGRGGNVQITTQGIFGLQFRPKDTPLSDITASSEFGVNGTVQINTPGVDPSRGLTDLAIAAVDASKQIVQNCPARGRRQGSSFIITGNGGLPPRPGDPFTLPYPTGTVRGIPSSDSSDPQINPASSPDTSNPDRPPATPTIEEAQGWVYGPHGEVILTATAPTLTPQNAGLKPATCPQS